jgi:hypothetical protein
MTRLFDNALLTHSSKKKKKKKRKKKKKDKTYYVYACQLLCNENSVLDCTITRLLDNASPVKSTH